MNSPYCWTERLLDMVYEMGEWLLANETAKIIMGTDRVMASCTSFR